MLTDPHPGDTAPAAAPDAALDVVLAVTGLEAATAADALDVLAARLRTMDAVDTDFPAALRDREATYPTGLATPVPTAIPHAEPQHVRTSGLVVATLAAPVPFGAMGGQGENVAAELIAIPLLADARAHLRALQALMGLLRDEEAVRDLLAAGDDAELASRTASRLRGGSAA